MEQSLPGCVSGQLEEYIMKRLKKGAIAIAAASMVLSPVAASAAPAVDGARATSVVSGENNLEGASWIAIVLVSPSLPGVSGWSSMTTTTIRSARKILRPTAPVPYKAGRALAFLAWEKAGDDLARAPRGAACFGVDAAPARLYLGVHHLAPPDDRPANCTPADRKSGRSGQGV